MHLQALTNLQMFGIKYLQAIINPAAIFTNAIGSNFGKVTYTDKFSNSIGGSKFDLKAATAGAAIDFFWGK